MTRTGLDICQRLKACMRVFRLQACMSRFLKVITAVCGTWSDPEVKNKIDGGLQFPLLAVIALKTNGRTCEVGVAGLKKE